MSADQMLDDILRAHEAVAEAEAEVNDRSAHRRHLVSEALAAGVGAQKIADALEVSRTRVYKLATKGYR